MITFRLSEAKTAEALAYIASEWSDITQFYAAKVIFFAEKKHINTYARPILADRFIAMKDGPVPSTVLDLFRGNFRQIRNRGLILDAVEFVNLGRVLIGMVAKRKPNLDLLSQTDVECLKGAIEFCRGKEKGFLSELSHEDRAWTSAGKNGPMDYAMMIDVNNPHGEEILEELESFARYGVM